MNDKSLNSLVSAYHDGELTAAERLEVESLLATSAEARAELEGYRRMSSLLREAGSPPSGIDLAPLVMQTIGQQQVQPTRVTRPQERSITTPWTAIAAVAAGLIAVVGLTWQMAPNNGPQVANRQPDKKPVPSPVIDTNDVKPETKTAVAVASQDVKPVAPEVKPEAKPGVQQVAAADLPLDVIKNLKRVNPAKIVTYLSKSGKDVSVFHLMVLDTKPGLESLQLILSSQQIAAPKDGGEQSGVMAVYVEANQNQLDKVIAELQREEQPQFVGLAVQQSPVKAEELRKIVKSSATDVASQQVPLKQGELTTLGVNPVQSEQMIAALKGRGGRSVVAPLASNGDSNPIRKLLIILEKAPDWMRN